MSNRKIVLGITAPLSVILIEGQARYYRKQGYDVYLFAPRTDVVEAYCEREGCTLLPVSVHREISPWQDLVALVQVVRHLLRVRPDVVNVGTPKMGLLGMIGAFLTGVPKRVYTCRGFRYEHETGWVRRVLTWMDRLATSVAHHVVCISPSIREMGVADRIFSGSKAIIIGSGSSNGVNLERFEPNAINRTRSFALRSDLGFGDAFVFGFVGRIVDRKGVQELYDAFVRVNEEHPNTRLLIVGLANHSQVSNPQLLTQIEEHPAIRWVGFQEDVPLYMSLMDVFVLPAWWEGFGNTLIQAAAMGIPVISTNVTGCRDAVSDGYNGVLVEKQNVDALKAAMLRLYEDQVLRAELGKNGRQWARRFDSERIWSGLVELYES